MAKVPAKIRGVSLEPLLGPLNLRPWLLGSDGRTGSADDGGILSWVIVGGESGRGARPMHPQWARDIRDQCQEAGVPFFFKQRGEHAPQEDGNMGQLIEVHSQNDAPDYLMRRCGKKAAGALLDGRERREMPA